MLTGLQVEAKLLVQQVTGCTSAQATRAVETLVSKKDLMLERTMPSIPPMRPNIKDSVDEISWSVVYPAIDEIAKHVSCSKAVAANVCYELHRQGLLHSEYARPVLVGDTVLYEDWCGPQKVVSVHFVNDPDKKKSIGAGDIPFVSLEPLDQNSKSLGHDVWLTDVDLVEYL